MATTTYETTADGVYIKNIQNEITHTSYESVCEILSKTKDEELFKKYDKVRRGGESFHAWVYDKKNKKIIDTYTDTDNWKMANTYRKLHKLMGVKEVIYEEFDRVPKNIQLLIDWSNMIYDLDSTIIRSINYTDEYGMCLYRAIAKHRSNPKRYKLKIGTVKWEFADGTVWDTECEDDNDMRMLFMIFEKIKMLSRFKSRRLSYEDAFDIISWWKVPKEMVDMFLKKIGY